MPQLTPRSPEDKRACQQYELYAAENHVPRGREFRKVEELQAYLDNMREQIWWERFYPHVQFVKAHFVPGSSSVGGWFPEDQCGIVEMAPPGRNELIVCHEMAHVLSAARYNSQAHSPWFARVYLELVYFNMGFKVYEMLRRTFKENSIKYDPPHEDFEWGRARFEL